MTTIIITMNAIGWLGFAFTEAMLVAVAMCDPSDRQYVRWGRIFVVCRAALALVLAVASIAALVLIS